MQGEFKILVQLLGIEQNEVPIKFEKGKPVFDGGLYEVKSNLEIFGLKVTEGLSIRDSLEKEKISIYALRFLKKLERFLSDNFGKPEIQ